MSAIHLDVLRDVRVASPCPANWDDMVGDAKVRHCSLCGLNVHNLSAMSREEAEALVQTKLADPSRRLCVQFYRRNDGTMLTEDCPRGLAAVRRKVRRTAARLAAALGLAAISGLASAHDQSVGRVAGRRYALQDNAAVRWVTQRIAPKPPPAILGKLMIKGECASIAPSRPAPTRNSGALSASNR